MQIPLVDYLKQLQQNQTVFQVIVYIWKMTYLQQVLQLYTSDDGQIQIQFFQKFKITYSKNGHLLN